MLAVWNSQKPGSLARGASASPRWLKAAVITPFSLLALNSPQAICSQGASGTTGCAPKSSTAASGSYSSKLVTYAACSSERRSSQLLIAWVLATTICGLPAMRRMPPA